MAIWYIKRIDKNSTNIFKKFFKPISIKNVDNKVIAQIPSEKYARKLEKRIYDKANQNLVILNNLNQEAFEKIGNILNGRWLFKFLIPEILEFILKQGNADALNQEVSVTINDNNQNNLKLLAELATKVKLLNVVTENICRFNGLESYLLNEKGIAIRVTNNKRKALLKSNIVFNLDFPPEIFNKYYIPRKSIIINMKEKMIIKSKRFEGINCNYYSIDLPTQFEKWFRDNEILGFADETILLESMLFYKSSYDDIRNGLKNAKVRGLIGNNGIIKQEEIFKIFT